VIVSTAETRVAHWLRDYHDAVADFVPRELAVSE
jgi:hypothetical protein